MKCIAVLVLVLALVAGIGVNGSQAQTMNATNVAFEHTREGNHDVLGANAPTIPPIHQAATVIGTVAGQMIPEPVGRTPVVRVIPDIPTITGAGLENSAALPTQDDWQRQLAAGKSICPTVQELNASRQQLAREALHSPNPTEAYKTALAKHAGDWLAQCRAQLDWAVSHLKQTPEGRAYLARVAAHISERFRLECGCAEGYAFVVIDQGGGPSYGAQWAEGGSAIQVTPINAGAAVVFGTAIVNYLEAQGSLTPEQARAARATIGVVGATAGVFNARVNQSLQFYADMQRYLSREFYYDMQMRGADGGGPAISDIWRGGRDPERP